jgi:hypothetical protein
MKDPTRLLDASASELELQLLRAGAAEQPPPAAIARLADKLGVAASGARAASKLSSLHVAIAALGITVASVVWLSTRTAPPPAAEAPAAPPRTEPIAAPAPPTATQEPPTHSLAVEIARIDAIRSLLAADHAKAAITAAQDFQRDFPSGMLRQEADVLNVEAHRRAGERRRARVLATRFLAEHPQSPHSARVRDLLDAL